MCWSSPSETSTPIAAEIGLEGLEPILDRARRAVAEIVKAHVDAKAVLDFALTASERSPETYGEFMRLFADADRRVKAAFAAPLSDDTDSYAAGRVAQPLLAFAPTDPTVRRYRSGLFRKDLRRVDHCCHAWWITGSGRGKAVSSLR